jgi:hypothetical protein
LRMNIRELLQIEIWSKRTTRGILKGFGISVVALLVAFVGLKGLGYVSLHWLTSGEREAARGALSLIDSLQLQYAEGDQKEFDTRLQEARKATEISRQAAKTARDMQVYFDLSSYLLEVDLDQKALRHYSGWQQKTMDPAKSNYLSFVSSEVEVRRVMSVRLHNTLDK